MKQGTPAANGDEVLRLRSGRHEAALSAKVTSPEDAALPADDPPYTTALLLKLSAALGEIDCEDAPAGLSRAIDAADILRAHGLALVDPERHRHWVDETVYTGALFRLHVRLRESPPDLPTITLPQDLFV